MTALDLNDVSVRFGDRTVLDRVSAQIGYGEVVGVLGPNGAGKSTLLRAIQRLCPFEGQVRIGDTDVGRMSARELARCVAYVPQDRTVTWPLSVAALVDLGRLPYRQAFSRASAAGDAVVAQAMERMDIGPLSDRVATTLSGGEMARVLIARALAQDTPILLADEPTAGLDPEHQIRLLELLRKLSADGKAVVLTLHDLHLAAQWCDRVVLLGDGQVRQAGPPDEVLTRDTLRGLYGCGVFVERIDGRLIVVPTGSAPVP